MRCQDQARDSNFAYVAQQPVERCEKWKWHHRLETGDYAGAARDCTQALKMSDQAIPWWPYVLLTFSDIVWLCFIKFPHFTKILLPFSTVPALVGGSVGTQGHCQAAPKGSARCSGRLGWGHQTWPIQLQGMAAWRHGGMTRFRPCLPRACGTVDWQTATSQYKS